VLGHAVPRIGWNSEAAFNGNHQGEQRSRPKNAMACRAPRRRA
jgi:hypothetical protein